jgi:hypothetical protein
MRPPRRYEEMKGYEVILCETCGVRAHVPSGFQHRCENCAEVERRLLRYLRSDKGRLFAEAALKAAPVRVA